MGNKAEKAEKKEREGTNQTKTKQTFTSFGLKIQKKEKEKPVQQLIEF